jgi:photosystem II stability/assembly factor-like uncharacterized protein
VKTLVAALEVSGVMRSTDGGESWSDCSADLLRLAVCVQACQRYRGSELMSVGLHHGDANQVYVAARYGEVFGTGDGGESWLEMPLPKGVQHIYALACG